MLITAEKAVERIKITARTIDTIDCLLNFFTIWATKYIVKMTPIPQPIAKKRTYSMLTLPKMISKNVEAAPVNMIMYILVLAATLGATPIAS